MLRSWYCELGDLRNVFVRVFRFWRFLWLVWAYGLDLAVVSGGMAGPGRNLSPEGAYALIAAISGAAPKMFMTRLRL